ncbi:MAG: dienelactone hydrolase family protein [Chlamydiales bacterium]|nr:dienelactone hydrolase family protein [Chlamydiales bacterium]
MKFNEVEIGGLECIEVAGDPTQGTIVLFHGYGANALDLAPLARVFMGPRWLFPNGPVEIPIAADYTGRGWFNLDLDAIRGAVDKKQYDEIAAAFSPELEKAHTVVENFVEALHVPHDKLVLGGFSQGAVLAIESALRFYDQVKALLIFSGILVHEESWKEGMAKHKGLPFFQSHGRNDRMLPFALGEKLEKVLKEGGLDGRLHPFTGGHEIPFSLLLDLQPFLGRIFK